MAIGRQTFFGRHVLASTFVLAIFGWGVGFYGPPIYLQNVIERTGWNVSLVSSAVTLHFVLGAVVVANLPRLYRKIGIAWTTTLGACVCALGTYGWAVAATPLQLFAAAALSGMGWVALGAAAVNALIAPWFVVKRPAALGMAYNGASVGGILFSPLWVALIKQFGFAHAAALVGIVMVITIALLSRYVFSYTPEQLGQHADGLAPVATTQTSLQNPNVPTVDNVWRDKRFLTLCAGMALGLFAQIGLIAHLFSIIVPLLGKQVAGFAMGFATCCAIIGRMVVGKFMPAHTDRRLVACSGYALQVVGSLLLLMAHVHPAFLWLGLTLFGSGIGNATSLPALIAQVEFAKTDTQRVIPLIVAISQGTYAFAPAAFGLLRGAEMAAGLASGRILFVAAAAVQISAIAFFYLGRRRYARANVRVGESA